MRVFFSVGEPSGDVHASRLIRDLQQRVPGIECCGLGGPRMQAAGCQLDFQLTDLAVMGFFRVLPMLGKFWNVAQLANRCFDTQRPDAVVLIDFPGFNWWIAAAAKRRGIPVFYYVPPQIWAWASYRVSRMRKNVKHVLCCLPFETEWYRQRGVAAEFVGHPFFDEVAEQSLDGSTIAAIKSSPDVHGPLIAILPGSRSHEVSANFPIQLTVMSELQALFPSARFAIAAFKPQHQERCRQMIAALPHKLNATVFVHKTPEIMAAADVCLAVSGSVSLELLAARLPTVIVYRVASWIKFLGRLLAKIKYITLPNIIADRVLMPEFTPSSVEGPENAQIVDTLSGWLSNPEELQRVRNNLDELARQVCTPGATARAADALVRHLAVPEFRQTVPAATRFRESHPGETVVGSAACISDTSKAIDGHYAA